ncbi:MULTISPECIES: (2,3-dihydroxybenzoyl)adenylate synthase [unclassified Streptomyces]|uniref:(2,3-dihydroxybenzoyl)adenylate synthase n=1 Tax=unclassified Streptomyces TaxID=2593676 RepID=UPI0004BD1BA2|nr:MULTISPECIES: AMP-binding protein [unclassified Streptomyces]
MSADFVSPPAAVTRRYRELGYWTDETLGAWPSGTPGRADRTALIGPDRDMTFAELDLAADRMAAGLRAHGLRPGEHVVVQLPNTSEFVVLSLALFRLGARPVFALPAHREAEITHLVDTARATLYICPPASLDPEYGRLAKEVAARCPSLRDVLVAGACASFPSLHDMDAEPQELPAPDPLDVALFLLSGGTTGRPKLIPRTHADYTYQLRESARLCGFGPDSRYLAVLPAAHNFALACPGVLGTLRLGGAAVLAPAPTPEVCFPLVERTRATATSLVPPLLRLWLDAAEWNDRDLSSLGLLQVGGAKLDADTARRVPAALGCTLQQVYGMAEGLLNYTRLDDPRDVVFRTQGRPLSPADEILVLREDGSHAGPGEPGELLTRGPYTLRGYHRAPEHNRARFTEDGYYLTGDLVTRSVDGNLEVVGRVSDVVNRGGEKVPALELEEHLGADPRIEVAAVVALPDELMGECTCACVVPADAGDPPTLRAVHASLKARGIAAYKLPDRLVVRSALPLTAVGKVDKKALREEVLAG